MNLSQRLWSGGCLAFVCLAAAGCQAPRSAGQPVPTQSVRRDHPATLAGKTRHVDRRTPADAIGSSRRATQAAIGHGNAPSSTQIDGRNNSTLQPLPGSGAREAQPPAIRLASSRYRVQQPPVADDPFAPQQALQLSQLVGEVLARNRTLEAMRAAWQASVARYPQAIALDDPVFTSLLAPASLNSGIVNIPGNSAGYMAGGAQKLPWFGKRPLRAQVARAEASSSRLEAEDMRLQIAEAAGLAYFDYYLVRQHLALNAENTGKLREFHDIAARKYEANLAPQQDMLQAKVELAELARRQIELERLERVAIARINTLMHRPPDAYLPQAPSRLESPQLAFSVVELRGSALMQRPDLAALGAQIRAEQSRLQLTYKEFYPDFEVFARYDNFWSQASLRGQAGLNMNVPLYRQKRYAAVREAQWRLSQRRAEYEQRIDDINREVQTAYERFDESQKTVELYTTQILPAAKQNVDSAFAAYETSGGDFLRLVAAQRQLIVLQERYQEAIADYHRRRIELERVVGQPLDRATSADPIPPGE
jgi:outer membrane protein TolC